MIIIDNKFEIGAIVYLKTDKEQLERMVTGVMQQAVIHIYELSCGTGTCWADEIEISVEKNVLITSSN